jgi:pimeloyl-ACP methyl ester carboxylesterase
MTRRASPARFLVSTGPRTVAAVLDWGGNGPDLLFLHPNGFCAGLFEPLAIRLRDLFRCVAIDLRGHGGSAVSGDADFAYTDLARDVVEVVESLGLRDICLVGESLGGAIGVLADRLQPDRIDQLLLCEAVAFPASTERPEQNSLSEGALRRRVRWPEIEVARTAYASRPPLSELAPEAMDAYLRWGTRPTSDGVALRCAPATEARIFELAPTPMGGGAAWDHLPEVRGRATVVAGVSSFLPSALFEAQARVLKSDLLLVEGGHFFLQRDAEAASQLIRSTFLGR